MIGLEQVARPVQRAGHLVQSDLLDHVQFGHAGVVGHLADRVEAPVLVVRGVPFEQRLVLAAGVGHVPAPGGELAALGRGGQVRRLARDVVQPGRAFHRLLGQRTEQRLGVRVPRVAEQPDRAGRLDHPARVHDHGPVGPAGDHAEVVSDQDDRHAQPLAQVVDELKDLLLDGHVQRGGRLVRDEQLGLAGQRHGDHHALPHAAGQLVRVVADPLGRARHADQAEHLDGPRPGRLGVRAAVQHDGLGDLVPDRHRRVERRHRVLEDHADLVAPDVPHLVVGERGDLPAVQQDLAAGDVAAGRQQLHDRQRGHRLAAAGLADDAEAFAGFQAQADALQRVHGRAAQPDFGAQVF